jgi:hypothetical protein
MDVEYDTSDDDNYVEEKIIENISEYIINLYEQNKKTDTIENVCSELISLIEQYDIYRQISEYNEELYEIYENIIKEYMYIECPVEILDANNYNLPQKFIQWAYENTQKGLKLDYIERIYHSLI